MKCEVPLRIVVLRPLAGVSMQVQRGRDELLPPTKISDDSIAFDLTLTADMTGASPNFLGKYAQGPKDARFVYVNSGKHAGQVDTCWDRRAKLSLMSITREQIEEVLSDSGSRIETTMNGVGGDGGPTCASVKGLVWKVANG